MIKTIPGYKEVDVSMWFLLFFSIFFGMLIGDAGYGAIFFIINLFCHIKFRNKVKDKSIFFLTYILSAATIAWGVLSGTFFGQAYLPERVGPLLPYLRDNMNVQALCFFIGAAHLSIAHIWKFLRKFPSLKAFSEVGWIAILWGANFLARSLILGEVFASFGKWLFIGGAGLIILFTNPSKNILKSCGSGIGNFLLNIINSFTDVVSYIRLFAVGAATVAVADAFNQMALEVGQGSVVMGLVTALILFFGHTLNILLGAMAVLVHGVRLNVLEFSSHLDMEFSGVEYAPFKE
jgi:V/A-type H+-transporting ATPase subunit I